MTPSTMLQRMPAWLEQAWLARYLDRELEGAETAWFEAYMLEKPELLAVVDADTRIRDALKADAPAKRAEESPLSVTHAATASADDATTASSASAMPSSISAFPRTQESVSPAGKLRRPTWLALAATLVLGLGIGGIAMRAFVPPRSPDLVASPTRIIYDTMRGEAAPPRVEHADSDSSLVLIEVAVPPGAQSVTLHIDGNPDRTLAPSPDGFVSFLLPRELAQQHKRLTVSYALAGASGKHSIDLEMPHGLAK